MAPHDQAAELLANGVVIDSNGETVGAVGQIYLDNETDAISWVTVKPGRSAASQLFVPVTDATISGLDVHVPYTKAAITGAPHAEEAGEPLSAAQENDLYRFYGLAGGVSGDSAHQDTARPETDAQDGQDETDGYLGIPASAVKPRVGRPARSVTRSEERLRVGTRATESGRARLRKYVVTEQQTVTVPVTHEEVRVVREPLSPGDPVDGDTIGERSIEVTLHEDRVVVDKDIVGVEKVRLDTETVTEQRQVSEPVRQERVALADGTNAFSN